MRSRAGWLLLCALGAMAGSAHAAVTFQFRNNTDGPGEGLNDTTPFLPEGGNTATTLGEARLKVLEEAGRVWGSLLNSSVPIVVDARVDPLTCGSGGITLATAGPATAYRNPSGPQPDVFFPSALADSLAGTDIAATSGTADIRVTINLSLHNNLNCANGARFYYGFDHNHGAMPDLLEVLLHELGHGLGFSSFVDLTTGNGIIQSGVERFGSYDQYIFDEAANQSWTSMTAQQRLQAAARSGFLGWTGTNANNSRLRYTSGVTAGGRLMLYAPTTISTGSSVSHWDITLTPSALMEPFIINATNNFTDLTPCALKDIGWSVAARCFDGPNAVPTALNQTITIPEDTPSNIILGGSDGDGDALTFAITGLAIRGGLSAVSTTPPISTLYTPNQNANGQDSFTFTASDGNATSAAATVTINITAVNDAPAAVAKTATVQAGNSVGITLSGTDVDGDALTFAVLSNPASGTLSGISPNLTYTPNSGFSGADSFTYRANDAALASATVTVSITVTSAPNNGGGGGGGGATGLPFLLLLGGLLARARLRAARASC